MYLRRIKVGSQQILDLFFDKNNMLLCYYEIDNNKTNKIRRKMIFILFCSFENYPTRGFFGLILKIMSKTSNFIQKHKLVVEIKNYIDFIEDS